MSQRRFDGSLGLALRRVDRRTPAAPIHRKLLLFVEEHRAAGARDVPTPAHMQLTGNTGRESRHGHASKREARTLTRALRRVATREAELPRGRTERRVSLVSEDVEPGAHACGETEVEERSIRT